jgi:septal ring factor EnvC (AmiA/AmiB activator)
MARIEQLESEIHKKTRELNESLNVQYLLHETLKRNTKTLGEIEEQLKNLEAYLKYLNEHFDTLKQENQRLKLSCDEWVKRTITLEFELLSARDAAKNSK